MPRSGRCSWAPTPGAERGATQSHGCHGCAVSMSPCPGLHVGDRLVGKGSTVFPIQAREAAALACLGGGQCTKGMDALGAPSRYLRVRACMWVIALWEKVPPFTQSKRAKQPPSPAWGWGNAGAHPLLRISDRSGRGSWGLPHNFAWKA